MTTATFGVTGMTCQNCVNHVTEEIKTIDGVTAVEVFLVNGGESSVKVTSRDELDHDVLAAAVDEAGYELV